MSPLGCWTGSFPSTPLPVPTRYQAGVAGVDMAVFVTVRPIESDGTIAFAGQCLRGGFPDVPNFMRPIAGYANFDPEFIDPNADANGVELQILTAMHEVTHALGFSAGLFSSYFDPSSNTTFDIRQMETIDSRDFTFLRAPTINQAVRDHFQCTEIVGAEIERDGGPGTQGSHFDKRAFYSEVMQGSTTQQASYSQMTLAVLQDSGWYSVDFSAVTPFRW